MPSSYVGARGLMQLMTYTAKLVAKQAKLPYSKNKLKNPDYNIKLGSYYLVKFTWSNTKVPIPFRFSRIQCWTQKS